MIQTSSEGRITLTRTGRTVATKLLLRHHLIERMLTEMFGMEWYKVHDEAERLEHAVSDDFEAKLLAVLGKGKACPHGNIVGADTPEDRKKRAWLPLDEVEGTGQFVVMSVFERDRQLLEFLDGLSIRPGQSIQWIGRNYDETITLMVDERTVPLGIPVARRVWVKKGPARDRKH